jgi:hypothetical protein
MFVLIQMMMWVGGLANSSLILYQVNAEERMSPAFAYTRCSHTVSTLGGGGV